LKLQITDNQHLAVSLRKVTILPHSALAFRHTCRRKSLRPKRNFA